MPVTRKPLSPPPQQASSQGQGPGKRGGPQAVPLARCQEETCLAGRPGQGQIQRVASAPCGAFRKGQWQSWWAPGLADTPRARSVLPPPSRGSRPPREAGAGLLLLSCRPPPQAGSWLASPAQAGRRLGGSAFGRRQQGLPGVPRERLEAPVAAAKWLPQRRIVPRPGLDGPHVAEGL